MIRLARIHAESDVVPAGLREFADGGVIDLLQLDYARPRLTAAPTAALPEHPEYAGSFADALRMLGKALYLDPDFRVITSAGWNNSYACVEAAARILVEHGCPGTPVSAVRGANVLPILEDLASAGVRLDNVETGASWKSLRAPIAAANLLIGAGPIAAAFREGGRVVVAGSYDDAAPFIAAAVHQDEWSWKEFDRLAGAAAAARAASWPRRHPCDWLAGAEQVPAAPAHLLVTLEDQGDFRVDVPCVGEPNDAAHLLAWLNAGQSRDPSHAHADVQFNASQAAITATGPTQLHVEGCKGAAHDGCWRLEVLYVSGFIAETMIELAAGASAALRSQIAQAFSARRDADDVERARVTVQELASASGEEGGVSWLHVRCRTKTWEPCREFVDDVARFANANPHLARLPAGRPQVLADCHLWPARIPREAVDIAIDTRPAKEWE